MSQDTMIGVDLAKSVFQVHGASLQGHVKFRKRLTRLQFRRFMAEHAPSVVVLEACGGAHYWSREIAGMGHEVKLIAPQYVRPFVKRQKNDSADAEAIVIAAQRPEMRFVAAHTRESQAKAVLFRGRECLVRQRTELVNALRAVLYEFGHIVPKGIAHVQKIRQIVEADDSDLHDLVREEALDLLAQISEQTERITSRTQKMKTCASPEGISCRLQTMPGVGPLTALAIEAFAPDMSGFKRGRDFAAWLGLVPRQHSSGGKERLGRISKAGQTDIRRLLIIGAMSRINWLGQKTIRPGSWLARLLARKPRMLVAIALANKMARQIWAMLSKGENFRVPGQAVAG